MLRVSGLVFQCRIVGIVHNLIDSCISSTYNAGNINTHLHVKCSANVCIGAKWGRLSGSAASDRLPYTLDNTLDTPLSTKHRGSSAVAASFASKYRQVSIIWTWGHAIMDCWLKPKSTSSEVEPAQTKTPLVQMTVLVMSTSTMLILRIPRRIMVPLLRWNSSLKTIFRVSGSESTLG